MKALLNPLSLLTSLLVGILSPIASNADTNDYGNIHSYAGGGTNAANTTAATEAYLDLPQGMAFDAVRNPYFSQSGDSRIRPLDADTLTVRNDAPGSRLQLFDLCPKNQAPILDVCVQLSKYDTNGVALPEGSQEVQATVRLDGVVGRFSSYALVTFVPIPQISSPALISDGFQFSFSAELDLNYTVQFTDPLTPPDWQTMTNRCPTRIGSFG